MLWYYAWQCTANNSPKNGDFKGLFNINIATRANKKPSSHLMFEFHVGFGGCLWLILDISDYNDYNSTYCNSLTPIYKKTGRHPPFITSSKKVKDHRLFRISSPIQQLWVIQILFLLSLEADIETHILHKSYCTKPRFRRSKMFATLFTCSDLKLLVHVWKRDSPAIPAVLEIRNPIFGSNFWWCRDFWWESNLNQKKHPKPPILAMCHQHCMEVHIYSNSSRKRSNNS